MSRGLVGTSNERRFGIRWLPVALAAVMACHGGTVVDPPEDPPPGAGQLLLSLPVAGARAADELTATVTASDGRSLDLSTLRLVASLGQGIEAAIPFAAEGVSSLRFSVPLGAYAGPALVPGDGTIGLHVETKSGALQASAKASLSITAAAATVARPGDLARAYLAAERELLLRSIGHIALLEAKVPGIDDQRVSALTQKLNAQMDALTELSTAIAQVQAGATVQTGTANGRPVLMSPAGLPALDRALLATVRISPSAAPAAARLAVRTSVPAVRRAASGPARPSLRTTPGLGLSRSAALTADDIDLTFDIRGLADAMAESARDISARVRGVAGTTFAVLGAAALVAGAPELAAAAGGLALYSWLATTGVGAGTGLALEAGTEAVLDGQGSYESFANTGAFIGEAYLEQLDGYVKQSVLSEWLGETWGAVTGAGIDVLTTVSDFWSQEVEPRFADGEIPAQGYPQSPFSLNVLPTLNGSTYYVTVSTNPATDGATIRCQISGTDGYRFSQDAVTVGGVATFVAAAASPGSGIHDAINAFDLNGRASGSASLTF